MFVIAGASGRVGSIVAEELLRKHQKVKVLVRGADRGAPFASRGAEVAVGTLDDREFLTGALRDARGFFTLLPMPAFDEPDFFAAHRRMTDAMRDAVEASGVPHVVMISSVGAEMPAGHGPIASLHALETTLRASTATLTALRPGYFQENVAALLGPAREAGVFPNIGPPETAWRMITVREIAQVAVEALLAPPALSEVVDIHGPAYSARHVAELLGTALGKQLHVVDVPEAGRVDALVQAGLPRPFAEIYAEMYAALAKGLLGPRGDRLVQGRTTMEETIRSLVR